MRFEITGQAVARIRQEQEAHDELCPLPTITWVTDATFANGRWEMGRFVDNRDARVMRESYHVFFRMVGGVEFLIDGPMHYVDALHGKTLDYKEGRFEFR